MITFFTALVLNYQIHDQQFENVIWFESKSHCREAMESDIYDLVHELYKDTSMRCVETTEVPKVIRPRARPGSSLEQP